MKYCKLEKLGIGLSVLGLSTLRLPTFDSNENINEELTHEMMGYAFDNGINYVDAAYPYHDGNS